MRNAITILAMLVGSASTMLGLITLAMNGYLAITDGDVAWDHVLLPTLLFLGLGVSLIAIAVILVRTRQVHDRANTDSP